MLLPALSTDTILPTRQYGIALPMDLAFHILAHILLFPEAFLERPENGKRTRKEKVVVAFILTAWAIFLLAAIGFNTMDVRETRPVSDIGTAIDNNFEPSGAEQCEVIAHLAARP